MKKTVFLVGWAFCTATALHAQTDAPGDSKDLGEVVIRGAKVVSRIDGQLIYPSEEIVEAATSGYHFLRMLPLPYVKVDDVNETIAATSDLLGSVQVRINDVVATPADIQSLQPKEVEKVEYIDRPGVRYGEGVGIVINVITRRATRGYVVGASVTGFPKANGARGNAYAKLNRRNHELLFNYSGAYTHSNGFSKLEQTGYLLENGNSYEVERNTRDYINRNISHNFQARYSWIHAAHSAFLAMLSAYVEDNPRNFCLTDVAYPDKPSQTETTESTQKVVTPWLDLYWKTNWGGHQSLVANADVAYTHTDYAYRFASDKREYGYTTLGNTWSLQSEAIYENRLKPFTLSAGAHFNQKYIDNDYSGETAQVSQIRTSCADVFAQVQGSLWKLGYMAGLTLIRDYYHASGAKYDKLWLRPKLNLTLPVGRNFRWNYSFSTSPAPSKLQSLHSMAILTNGFEYSLGNAELIVARRDEHTLALSYQTPRWYNQASCFYRHNAHPAMQHIFRTDDNLFAKTYLAGRRIDMLMVQNYTSCDVVPSHLNASFSVMGVKIISDGQDYGHRLTSFNFNFGLTAWLGKWTFMASIDNGFHFMESEYECRNIFSAYLSASYRWRDFSASLFCQNPFKRNGKVEEYLNHNRLVSKHSTSRNTNSSSCIGLKLTWHLAKGRRFQGPERDTELLRDTETGVAKPE